MIPIRRARLLLLTLFFLLTSLPISAGAVDGWHTGSLENKTLLILGDSYCAGYGLENTEQAWPYLLSEEYGLTCLDAAVSGSTLAEGEFGRDPMTQRVSDIPSDPIDVIVIQGGSNDWNRCVPVGNILSRDKNTLLGALNYILDVLEKSHPEAAVFCFTPWISNGSRNENEQEVTVYTQAMLELCRKRGVVCYNAADAEENGIHMEREDFRAEYCLTPTDRWHLNEKGHALFAPVFGSWLERQLQRSRSRFSDLLGASGEMTRAAQRLWAAGVMNGVSENMFAPTQAATRLTLAVTLYRLAGQPETEPLSFSDVSPDNPQLAAVSWAVARGLLTGDGAFCPAGSLTRQELVTALYRYYTEIGGGEVTALEGVSQYADREQLPADAAIPWGWALRQGMLTVSDDHLRPQAAVSRGQLALALNRLLSLI